MGAGLGGLLAACAGTEESPTTTTAAATSTTAVAETPTSAGGGETTTSASTSAEMGDEVKAGYVTSVTGNMAAFGAAATWHIDYFNKNVWKDGLVTGDGKKHKFTVDREGHAVRPQPGVSAGPGPHPE